MGEKQNDPDALKEEQGNALQFDCEATGVTKEKHIVRNAFTWEHPVGGHNQSSAKPQTGKT